MTKFDDLRNWLWAAAGAAVLAAIALIAAGPADAFVIVIGFLLAVAAVSAGAWALINLNRLLCPQCGEQFAPMIATLEHLLPEGGWSDHCAHCGFIYERRRDWNWQPQWYG